MKSFIQQLRQLWLQLGLNQRVTIAVAGLAVLCGTALLLFWSQRPQMQLLYGRMSNKDMAAVMAAVQELGVKNEIGLGGSAIYVPSDQVHKVRMHLASKGIPAGEGVGFEIFDRANFGVSDFIQRTNYNRALQGELARTISQVQGVRNARVLVVIPENRLVFSDVKSKPTASVFVEGSLGQDQVNSIRFLVANAVENLKADDVAVVDHRGTVLTEGLREDPALGGAASQIKMRKNIEEYLTQKLDSMLSKVLGAGQFVVRVSAELDNESTTRTEERFDPEGQVVRTETATDDSTVTNENDSGGQAVGATSNLPSQGGDSAGRPSGKSSEQQKKNKTINYEINKIVTSSARAPGSVSRLSVSVAVASGAQPREAAKLDGLRKIVVNALGIKGVSDADLSKIVTVEEMPFPASQKEALGLFDQLSRNSEVIRDAASILVALGVFGVFMRMIKRTKPDDIPLEVLQADGGAESTQDSSSRGGDLASTGEQPLTVDLINQMIRRKPENVGAALRTWMVQDQKIVGGN